MATSRAIRLVLGHSGLAALAAAGVLLSFSPALAGTVRLTWTAPGDDGTTGQASAYDLRYSLTGVVGTDTTSWWNSAVSAGTLPRPQTAGSREAFTVAGLDSGKTYYFIIRTGDEIPNWSGYSNVAVRQAVGDVTYTLDTPGNFRGVAGAASVTLSWIAVGPGAGTEYRLYRQGPGDASPQLLQTLAIATTSWVDSTLTAGSTYEYRLATYGGGQEGTPAIVDITVGAKSQAVSPVVHAYPNPGKGHVTLSFTVPGAGSSLVSSRITIFDLTGQRISQVVDGSYPPGRNTVVWDCRSSSGAYVAPGIYNIIFETPSGRSVAHLAIVP